MRTDGLARGAKDAGRNLIQNTKVFSLYHGALVAGKGAGVPKVPSTGRKAGLG